jgi:phage shock protein A
MTELKLISNRKRQLKPLVEAALKNELRLLEAGIRRTEQNMRTFEEKFHLSTQEFIARYENDEMEESLDYADWIGEHRMLERLREKADTLRTIRFAN